MKKTKRLLNLVLSVLIIISIFIGCFSANAATMSNVSSSSVTYSLNDNVALFNNDCTGAIYDEFIGSINLNYKTKATTQTKMAIQNASSQDIIIPSPKTGGRSKLNVNLALLISLAVMLVTINYNIKKK